MLYSNSETLLQHLQNWADDWEKEEESDQKAWTLTAIDYCMMLVKVTAKTEIPSYSEIREEVIDEFAEKLKENIYPMSHGLGVHDIDRITESMKNSCISKTFREIDTDYIAEQLKEE